RLRSLFCRNRCCNALNDNNVDVLRNNVSHEVGQSISSSLGVTKLKDDVFSRLVAEFMQSCDEGLKQGRGLRDSERYNAYLANCTRCRLGSGYGGCSNRTCQTGKKIPASHSITSSARASSVAGTSRPSALAVLRLISISNLVGCSTGRSAGFAPLKILSTYSAARRSMTSGFGP